MNVFFSSCAPNRPLRRLISTALVLALLLVLTAGCSKRFDNLPVFSAFPIRDSVNHSVGRFKTSYLADQIHAYFRGYASAPIAVATFVSVDDLYESSSFGRILSEQLMTELAMRGYNVIEVRLADALQIMHNQGEFGMSRETHVIKPRQEMAALVVGTYAVSPVRVYLNARVIDPGTSAIISAGTVEMRKTGEIARLLRANSMPTTLERIPVRHLGYSTQPAPYYWPQYGMWSPPGLPQNNQDWGANGDNWNTPNLLEPTVPTLPPAAAEQPATTTPAPTS